MATDDLRARLAGARLYLCTDARQDHGDLAAVPGRGARRGRRHRAAAAEGPGGRRGAAPAWRSSAGPATAHGALLAVNDRADVAYAAGADILHLGQDDLPPGLAREILGAGPVIGLSTHARAEAELAAAEPAADYFCTGPVLADADQARPPGAGTQPGPLRRRAGHRAALVRHRRHRRGQPRTRCWRPGPRRVVVVRALTEAADPAAAARPARRAPAGRLSCTARRLTSGGRRRCPASAIRRAALGWGYALAGASSSRP